MCSASELHVLYIWKVLMCLCQGNFSEFHVLSLFYFILCYVILESIRDEAFPPRTSCRLLCTMGSSGSFKRGQSHRASGAPAQGGGTRPAGSRAAAILLLPAVCCQGQLLLCLRPRADSVQIAPCHCWRQQWYSAPFWTNPSPFKATCMSESLQSLKIFFFIICFWTGFVCVFPHIWMQGAEQVFQVMGFLGINMISLIN